MHHQKIISAILAFSTVLSLTACKNNQKSEDITEFSSTEIISEDIPQESDDENDNTDTDFSIVSSELNSSESTTVAVSDSSLAAEAEIIDFYKKAAEKSNKSAKSEQIITLKDISINNGQFEGVIDFVMPIMSKLLSNNSTAKDGITGGYKNLTADDTRSVKSYTSGDNTVIEMVMKEQTDGARGDALGGPVGHAITAVGDISVVTDQLNDLGLPIEISDKNTSIHYTNPIVKVVIDKNGKIIRGTWSYTVEIKLNNYKVGNSTVEATSVIMDNVITVNGGF